MFTLKSLSPSRTSLSIPISPSRSNPASPSSLTSVGSRSPSNTDYFPTPTSPNPAQGQKRVKKLSKEEALKNVKLLEDVLGALNDYRIAISNLGKSGRKLAGALRGLSEKGGGGDKVDVASQTMRPTASMLDNVSDLTLKLARKIDKEYDEVNSDASKYFTLLAKESRTHDAYLGAIGKKHEKAEKAYRKASKSLSETSNAHAGLLALKDTLSEDINRANEDHQCLIGTKQSLILLKIASSSGILAENVFAYFSDGLRKSGQMYPDIEYFRTLADIKWQSSLPPSLEHESTEEKRREAIRGLKAKVAMGELDMIGQKLWEDIVRNPLEAGLDNDKTAKEPARDDATSAGTRSRPFTDQSESTEIDPQQESKSVADKVTIPVNDAQSPRSLTETNKQFINSPTTLSKTKAVQDEKKTMLTDHTKGDTRQSTSPPIPHLSRPSFSSVSLTHRSDPSISTTSSTSTRPDAPNGRRPIPSGLSQTEIGGGSKEDSFPAKTIKEAERPISRYEDNSTSNDAATRRVSMPPYSGPPVSSPTLIEHPVYGQQVIRKRPDPIPVQMQGSSGQSRSVSNTVNDLQIRRNDQYGSQDRARPVQVDRNLYGNDHKPTSGLTDSRNWDSQILIREHRNHRSFVQDCELCEIDYKRMLKNRQIMNNDDHEDDNGHPINPPKNIRRVTMPPIQTSFDNSLGGSRYHNDQIGLITRTQQRNDGPMIDHDNGHHSYRDSNGRNSENGRRTSYEYDELFTHNPLYQQHYQGQNQSSPSSMEVVAPKPRRPINLSPELERYHS